MKFFHGCTSDKEAKVIYHKLAKCFHPDKGGSSELMVELQKQYESWDEPVVASGDIWNQQIYTPNNFGHRRGFQFNMIRESMEIQTLKHEITNLKATLNAEIDDKAFYKFRLEAAQKELEKLKKECSDLKEAMQAQDWHVKTLEQFVSTLKKDLDETTNKKPTLFQQLKQAIGVNSEK